MMIKLTGGKVYDPANGVNGEVRDIYIADGRVVPAAPEARIVQEYNLRGKVVMAGAIDPHTHIGGGKVTIARTLMPEDHEHDEVAHTSLTRAGTGHALPSTMVTGYRYAEIGYTACFEPAMVPSERAPDPCRARRHADDRQGLLCHARQRRFPAALIAAKRDVQLINDYVAWTMHATHSVAVKVVNPGGISAFKFNDRGLDLDIQHVYYGVTPRASS